MWSEHGTGPLFWGLQFGVGQVFFAEVAYAPDPIPWQRLAWPSSRLIFFQSDDLNTLRMSLEGTMPLDTGWAGRLVELKQERHADSPCCSRCLFQMLLTLAILLQAPQCLLEVLTSASTEVTKKVRPLQEVTIACLQETRVRNFNVITSSI